MAKRKPNGEYSGLTGNVILYEMNGVGIMRIRSRNRKDKSSQLKEIRTDFGSMVKLITSLKKVIDIGFRDYSNKAAYHSALSVNLYNYKEAAALQQPDNLAWLQLSHGKLSGAESVSATMLDDGRIEVRWQGTQPGRPFHDSDIAMGGVYKSKAGEYVQGDEVVTRKEGVLTLNPGDLPEDEILDVFLFFRTSLLNSKKNGNANVSVSQWAGQF